MHILTKHFNIIPGGDDVEQHPCILLSTDILLVSLHREWDVSLPRNGHYFEVADRINQEVLIVSVAMYP